MSNLNQDQFKGQKRITPAPTGQACEDCYHNGEDVPAGYTIHDGTSGPFSHQHPGRHFCATHMEIRGESQ